MNKIDWTKPLRRTEANPGYDLPKVTVAKIYVDEALVYWTTTCRNKLRYALIDNYGKSIDNIGHSPFKGIKAGEHIVENTPDGWRVRLTFYDKSFEEHVFTSIEDATNFIVARQKQWPTGCTGLGSFKITKD